MRKCKVCLNELSLELFPRKIDSKTKKEIYLRTCSECYKAKERERVKTYYENNPEAKIKNNERSKNYVLSEEQKIKRNISIRKWQAENPSKVKEAIIKRQNNNREKINEYGRKYSMKNRSKLNENYNKYYSGSIEGNFLMRCNSRWKGARKKYNLSNDLNKRDIKKKHFRELFDKQSGVCTITGVSLVLIDPLSNEPYLMYEIDHIIPLSKGGTHELLNIQLTFPPANRIKGGS